MTTERNTTPPDSGPPPPPPPPTPPPDAEGYLGARTLSTLRRSRSDRKVGGVCGGVARWLGIDPLVLRVTVVILTVFGGSGVLIYALAWLLLPEDGETESPAQRLVHGRTDSSVLLPVGVVVVGLLVLGGMFGWRPDLGSVVLLAILAAGFVVAMRNGRERGPLAASGAAGVDPRVAVPDAPRPDAYGRTAGTAYFAPAAPAALYPPGGWATAPAPPYAPSVGPWIAPRPPRPRSALGRVTFSAAMLTAGGLAAASLSGAPVTATGVVAGALAVTGVGLLVGSLVGRARGLIALGLILSLALAVTATVDSQVNGSGRTTVWRPAGVADVRPSYSISSGRATLDLSHIAPGAPVTTSATVGVGRLTVVLPRTASLAADLSVGVGSACGPDKLCDGGLATTRRLSPTPSGGTEPSVTLHAFVGVGKLQVRRASS